MASMIRYLMLTLILMCAPVPAISAAAESIGLKKLDYLTGRWNATTKFHEDGRWSEGVGSRAVADTYMGGAFQRLQMVVPFPGAAFQFEMIFSYDRFNKEYRIVLLDDLNGYVDIYRGQLEDGKLTATNTQSGTAFPTGTGGFVYGQIVLEHMDAGDVRLSANVAFEEDGDWVPYMQIEFAPVE